jgi:hypothetical protein
VSQPASSQQSFSRPGAAGRRQSSSLARPRPENSYFPLPSATLSSIYTSSYLSCVSQRRQAGAAGGRGRRRRQRGPIRLRGPPAHKKFRVFPVFSFFFDFFGLFPLFRFYTETESFDVLIEPKQTEDPPKPFKREYIWVFFRKFRVVSVCFGLLRNSSVCFGCFDIGSKNRNKLKFLVFCFTKQTETNGKQILFRFVSVRTEIYFCLFRGHPS